MITAIFKIPGFFCYLIAFAGIACALYSGTHKNKYKLPGKIMTYCACLCDIVAGIVYKTANSITFPVILGIIELGLLITAITIEIHSAKFQGMLFVVGNFIVGCIIGCLIIHLFVSIHVILGVLGTAVILFFFTYFDDGSSYYDPDNEFYSNCVSIDDNYCEIEDAYKERFSGRNIIRVRSGERSDYYEQEYEGSSTYRCQSDNSEYTRVGNRFIKK